MTWSLLYFSGHGFKDDTGRLYLITNDSRKQLLGSTAVSAQFVREQLDHCRSRRKVVILDCCYAGAFPPGTTRGADAVDVLEGLGGRGSAVITASSALEYAFENGSSSVSAVDEVATPSVFTSALIAGLATGSADKNGDGIIDIDELYDYVYSQVKESIPQQTPGRRSDVEGVLYIAASPRGPRPAVLNPEIIQAVQHPLASVRLAVVNDLYKLCSGVHAGLRLAARNALNQLTDDDSRGVSEAARSACELIDKHAGKKGAESQADRESIRHGVHRNSTTAHPQSGQETAASDDILAPAVRDAEAIRTIALREADELTSTTEREAAKLRATADHEVAEKRAAAERDIARLRTSTEREVAQLKATVKRERDEILTASKRQADEIRSQARRILEESETQRAQAEAEFEIQLATRREEAEALAKIDPDSLVYAAMQEADEIRSQARRILEESETQRAQAEAEFEIQLAARREEAERQEAERLAAAQSATQKLVSEAEQRASTAEQHAAKASAQADQTRRDADSHARQLVSNAKKNADQIVSQAKTQAEQMLAETRADAERRRVASQREVDELTRQKDSIASHLVQVRQLLGGRAKETD